MTEFQLGYVVGLFDGEGCINIRKDECIVLEVNSTDLDILEKFQESAGIGTISGPTTYPEEKNKKPLWRWSVSSAPEVYEFLTAVEPHLCTRRRGRIEEAFVLLKEKLTATIFCEGCGEEVLAYTGKLRRTKFCSKKCGQKIRARHYRKLEKEARCRS